MGFQSAAGILRDLGLPIPGGRRLDVAGKVVLITGGADGIGLALARRLHRQGATVALIDVSASGLKAADSALGGDRVVTVTADIRDRAAMADAVAEIVRRVGGIDVVIANAGVTPSPATLRTIDPADFDRVMDINITGTFNTVHATVDEVIARAGHLVVISSGAAFTPGPGGAPYMISKAAVEQLGRALRLEVAANGATAGVVYFGMVDTALASATLDDDQFGRALDARLPGVLSRRMSADKAAEVIGRAIERRAGRVMAPAAWEPWALGRGFVNVLADGVLAADAKLHHLIRDLESRSRTARPASQPQPDKRVNR
nr:SDR family oxidoreductase [Tomitella biformata]